VESPEEPEEPEEGAASPEKIPSAPQRAEEAPAGKAPPPVAAPILTPGTVFEVVFAVFLLGGLLAGVLYMGRHLSEFREELVDVTLPSPSPVDPGRPAGRAFRPGSAERVVAEVRYRLLDEEPAFPRAEDPAWLESLEESPAYREGLQEFRSGNYGRAAEVWGEFLGTREEESATVHAGSACDPEALRNTADFVGRGFLMVRSADREECFECLWGVFGGRQAAREAMGGTPLPANARVILTSEAP
jgi:hypothetical protein